MTSSAWEDQRCVDPPRQLVERVEHALSQWNDAQRALLFAVRLGLPVREGATDVHKPRSVDVSPLEVEMDGVWPWNRLRRNNLTP